MIFFIRASTVHDKCVIKQFCIVKIYKIDFHLPRNVGKKVYIETKLVLKHL